MILALAGQFKQLSHEPEKFRWLNGIRTHDLCDAGAVLKPTELWSHTVESRSICWAHVFPWKECSMKEVLYEVRCLKSTEDMILALAGQFFHGKTWAQQIDLLSTVWLHSSVGLSTAPASQRSWVRIPLSHLNFSGSWDNCLNCPASARIISSVDFKHRTSYNTSFVGNLITRTKHLSQNDWNLTHIKWSLKMIPAESASLPRGYRTGHSQRVPYPVIGPLD